MQGDIDQLLQALLGNAVAHTPQDGTILATCKADGDGIIVEISDSGPGIEPEEADRIFDRFWRARAQVERA